MTTNDGDRIDGSDIPSALTKAQLVYGDGATQTFSADGTTVYVERGQSTDGQWKVDDEGRFQSFWSPAEYTTYDVSWISGEDGQPAGIRFREVAGAATFEGRYAV